MHNSLRLRDSSRQTPQGLRILLGAFRGGNPLERIVGVPSLWPRSGGVLQLHGLGFSRQVDSEQANFRAARDSTERDPSWREMVCFVQTSRAICDRSKSATQRYMYYLR